MVELHEIDDSSSFDLQAEEKSSAPPSRELDGTDSTHNDHGTQVLPDNIPKFGQEDEIATDATNSSALAEFLGTQLVSRDGADAVTFYSNWVSWSLGVPWMVRNNPSAWLDKRFAIPRHEQFMNIIFSPINDYLIYKNAELLTFTDQKSLPRLRQDVLDVACEEISTLDAICDVPATICTAHLFSQLVDKMMWAYDLRDNKITIICLDDSSIQRLEDGARDENRQKKIKAVKDWHNKLEHNWKSVVVNFIHGWNDDAMKAAHSKSSTAASRGSDDTRIFLDEMLKAVDRQCNMHKVTKAMSRIHEAVLALSTFRLFNLKDAKNLKRNKKFSFHDALM